MHEWKSSYDLLNKKMQKEVPTPKAALRNLAALVSFQRIHGLRILNDVGKGARKMT
jgi:hypothetical protein